MDHLLGPLQLSEMTHCGLTKLRKELCDISNKKKSAQMFIQLLHNLFKARAQRLGPDAACEKQSVGRGLTGGVRM